MLKEEIETIQWKIRKCESELDRWLVGGDLSSVRITTGSRSSRLEEEIQDLNDYLEALIASEKRLIKMVSRFKGLDNKIIKMKYIDGMALKEIAHELNYSYQYIVNKHSAIVSTIKFIEHIN